jgi:hypothetical protein
MVFKISSNTSISNVPDITFSLLINKPTVMAQTSTLHANTTLTSGGVSLTANTLTI